MIALNMYMATVSGLMMLTFCSDMLVTGATHIGRLLRLSTVFVGVVVVGFGTSLPEILTTLISGLRGESTLGVGNIIGSNIANIGLILGTALILFGTTRMKTSYARNDYIMMMLASVLLCVVAFVWGYVSVVQSVILLAVMAAVLLYLLSKARTVDVDDGEKPSWGEALAKTFTGLLGLWLGAELLVTGSIGIATSWGVPSEIIGLSMVALGTSLPELAATFAAARQKNCGIILGNIMGSNMLNIFAALGLGGLFVPLTLDGMGRDLLVMMMFSVALLPLFVWQNMVNRTVGVLFVLSYTFYIAYIYLMVSTPLNIVSVVAQSN